jgi:hypothetical protein
MKQIFLGKRIPPKKIRSSMIEQYLQKDNTIVYSSKKLNGKVIYETK